jgi:hypothetical protein
MILFGRRISAKMQTMKMMTIVMMVTRMKMAMNLQNWWIWTTWSLNLMAAKKKKRLRRKKSLKMVGKMCLKMKGKKRSRVVAKIRARQISGNKRRKVKRMTMMAGGKLPLTMAMAKKKKRVMERKMS